MKTIQKEKIQKSLYEIYIANDGTEFSTAEECRKYENSAEGVIMAKIKPLIVKDIDEESILGWGNCDNTVWVMKLNTQDDADTLMQACILYNDYLRYDEHKESLERMRQIVQRSLDEKDVIFVGRGWENDCFWFYGSRNSLKEKLDTFMNIEKKEDNA